MKIPKAFHPILGVLTGFILFLPGIAVLSAVFVATYKAIQYAKPFERNGTYITALVHISEAIIASQRYLFLWGILNIVFLLERILKE